MRHSKFEFELNLAHRLSALAASLVITNETIARTATVDSLSLSVWHQRLSHVNYKTIVKMVSGNMVHGIIIDDYSIPTEIEIRRLRLFQAICLQNEKRDESQHSHNAFRRGGEFLSTELVNWLTEKCIRYETTAAHTPQQNGVIERDHRTTGEAARSAMLNMKNIPQELWAET